MCFAKDENLEAIESIESEGVYSFVKIPIATVETNVAILETEVALSLGGFIEARDAAKAAFETNQAEQEQFSQRIRKLEDAIHRAKNEPRGGLAALQAINEANREISECTKRLDVLRRAEGDLRSVLARTQHEIDKAAHKAFRYIQECKQQHVRSAVDLAYQLADNWRDALDAIADRHGIALGRSLRLNVLAHSRISKDRFGEPPFQPKEAANG